MIYFLLSYIRVQYLLIYSTSKSTWHTSLSILHKEWLIVFLNKSLTNQYSFIDKRFFLINAHLSKGHIELMELASEILQVSCLEIQFDFAPLQSGVSSKIRIGHLGDSIKDHLGIINRLIVHKVYRLGLLAL